MELGEDHTEGAQYRDGRGEHLPGEENVVDAIDAVTVAARGKGIHTEIYITGTHLVNS